MLYDDDYNTLMKIAANDRVSCCKQLYQVMQKYYLLLKPLSFTYCYSSNNVYFMNEAERAMIYD